MWRSRKRKGWGGSVVAVWGSRDRWERLVDVDGLVDIVTSFLK